MTMMVVFRWIRCTHFSFTSFFVIFVGVVVYMTVYLSLSLLLPLSSFFFLLSFQLIILCIIDLIF